ncbi:MAG: PepSY-associated TM helix domain-containing protein [Rheinheimera sp.]|nr:PepSY-associated TM helix domain-containing protein [Rheinheimera sp.]
MKVATQKSYRLMHTWVGLITGSLLFIAFYAGAITVFSHELYQWLHQARSGPTVSQPVADQDLSTSLPVLQQQIDTLLQKKPEASHGFSLLLPGHHGPEAQLLWFDSKQGMQHKVTMQDGELQLSPAREDLVSFIYDLHFTAGLPRTFGTYLFGIVCILYGLALVSGVVIYTPVIVRDLLAMRWQQGMKTRWLDLHNLFGITSLPFHIIFAWSGAVLTIGFVLLAPFQFTVYDGKLLEILEPEFEVLPHVEPAGKTQPLVPLDVLYAKAQQTLPALHISSAFYHDAGDLHGNVTFFGDYQQAAGEQTLTATAAVVLSTADGKVVGMLTPEQFRPGTVFLRGLQSLHYGNFAGDTGKWLYFVLGLAGALLFYSGNWLWLRRKLAEGNDWKLRLMAGLTNGVCLGTVAAISLLFAVAAWLPASWNHPLYVAVLAISVAWALLRPARAARTELLALSALLTLLVPLCHWSTASLQLLTALTALLLALLLAALARWSYQHKSA